MNSLHPNCSGIFRKFFRVSAALFSFFIIGLSLHAQIQPEYTVIENVPAEELVKQYLIGSGVETSNITLTGHAQASGRFYGKSNIGLDAGVILTSGKASNSKGPNNDGSKSFNAGTPGDVALNKLSGGTTHDACVLEFDFIPQSNIVEFRYVFASEEYPEYANSNFNDVFGFFISGPDIYGTFPSPPAFPNGAQNIALVPGVLPPAYVSINNINHINNSQYYVANGNGSTPALNPYIQYDGFTTVLTARAVVVPCQTYHIKLAIADVTDSSYDSGVFLEANSFSSVGVQSAVSFTHAVVDTAVENCNNAQLKFEISSLRAFPFTIYFDIEGTAINGVDYEFIPDSVVIPAGSLTATIDIIPIPDDIPEPTKVVELIFNTSFCDYIPDTARIFIKDYPSFGLNPSPPQSIECGQTATIHAGAHGGIEPWTFVWNTGDPDDNTDAIQVSPLSSTDYIVQVTDVCGNYHIAVIPVEVRGPQATIAQGTEINICLHDNINLTANGGTSWLWSTGETTKTINVAPTTNTTYTVTAMDACGNTDQAQILVTVGQPFAEAGQYDGICVGQSVELIANDTPNGAWVWTDMVSGATYNGRIVTVTPATSREYCVDVTDNCGNTIRDCTFIDVFQLTADAGTGPEICAGGLAELTGSSSTGSGTFSWTDGTNVYNGQTVQVSPTVTTTYTLTVNDGCEAQDQVTVTVHPLPHVTATSSEAAICPDDSFTLTAGGAATYNWTSVPFDPSMISPDNGITDASPLQTTVYTVSGTDAFGCTNTAVVGVTVKERMFADFSVSKPAVCEGDELIVTYDGNGQSYATYEWQFDGGHASASGQGPIPVSWTGAGEKTISLKVTQLGCESEVITRTVEVNAMPVAEFTTDNISGCSPLDVLFTSTSTNTVSGATYSWDLGYGPSASGQSAGKTFDRDGRFDISLTVTNPGGCVNTKVMTGLIEVWPLPVAGFDNNPPFASMKNPVISFSSTSTGDGLSYLWDMGDGTILHEAGFTHTYADTGYYHTVLTVENSYGCLDTFERTIYISPLYQLKIPTAFTPNGDGLNDEFRITGNGVREFRINIYDRWGKLVFTSSNIGQSWNGMVNGSPAVNGVYSYRVFFRDENDEVSEQSGSILILR